MSASLSDILLALAEERGAGKTFCPSEAARRLAASDEDWRRHLGAVRQAAQGLEAEGRLRFFRKGKPVPGQGLKRVYRLGL